MEHKKNWSKKTKKTVFVTSICALVLIGGASYGAYTTTKTAQESTTQSQEPLNPMTPKKKNSLLPETKEPKKKNAITPKKETSDSSLSDFRSENEPSNTLVQQRKNALETLNQQINEEQQNNKRKQAQPQPMVEPTKPSEEKPNQNIEKPTPTPTPKPQPKPEPEPEPPIPPVILVDYSVLSGLVEQAQVIDLSLYLSSSIGQFTLELTVSQRMLEDGASSQEAVNNQVARLQQAIDQLVLKGNKASLQATYDHSKTIVTDIYTTETVNALMDSQKQVKDLLATAEVDQPTIDRVQSALQQAIDGLKEKEEPELSLTYLNRVLAEANQLTMDDYTPMTAQVVKEKVTEINAYIEAGNSTKEDNERFTTELRQAIDHLQKRGDTTEIHALLAEIGTIDRSLYTVESLQALDTVIADVTNQLTNEEITQNEVDELLAQVKTVYQQLEKVSETPVNNESHEE